ncbi:hypothetical protein M8C21_032506, partial [Ambrosia artemisiifolia]
MKLVISAGFYDIALKLVEKYGELLSLEYLNRDDSPLALIAGKPEAFLSGTTFNFWQIWAYYYFNTKIADPTQEQLYNTRGTEMHEIRDNLEETTILMQSENQNTIVGYRDLDNSTRGDEFDLILRFWVKGTGQQQKLLNRINEYRVVFKDPP